MKRRVFAALLGSAALNGPIALAQVASRVPRIAVLDWESPGTERVAPLRRGLRELGYVEGESIHVEYRFAEGRAERAAALAEEIVRSGVDVIVALTTPAARAVQRATSTIAIVVASADPVGAGLVTNLSRPGGNLTGASTMMTDLESKRMELLREVLPGARRLAYLGSAPDPATPNFLREAQEAAARIGAHVEPALVDNPGEIDAALTRLAGRRVEAVIVQPLFTLTTIASGRVAELAARHGLPAIASFAHFPRSGGLLSFGPSTEFGAHAAAKYVDRILKGAKPGDLPIEQPATFELVLNLKTAKALGIPIPQVVLLRADELIE
ncbi:MAG: ABC transporter substrate-binding protein [Alphaproteobacteria bacterium]|nr:ABC transporter substrate-binding protein [Alphaproteobacteria bacterium]